MAAPMERGMILCLRRMISARCLTRKLLASSPSLPGTCQRRLYSPQQIEKDFLKPEVQNILKRVTGFDLEKIFATKRTKPHPPKYELLTDQQLQEAEKQARNLALGKLQMPPVMEMPVDEEVILSDDPEIAMFDADHPDVKYVFTDIAMGIKNRLRTIVVREPDGKLREANWEERNRVLQVYFPMPGRMYQMPSMFQEENLEHLLANGKHRYVLDRACVQFEPDDPEYIRVTQRTYENVSSTHAFDELRSTRHFGPMAFYLARYGRLDNLLVDCLQKQRLADVGDLVQLFLILHPDCKLAQAAKDVTDPTQLLELYIEHESKNPGMLQLALQSLNEHTQRAV